MDICPVEYAEGGMMRYELVYSEVKRKVFNKPSTLKKFVFSGGKSLGCVIDLFEIKNGIKHRVDTLRIARLNGLEGER